MTKKQPTPTPVDPFTIDWPESTFEVGEMYVVKPDEANDLKKRGIDCSVPLKLTADEGGSFPYFEDCNGVIRCVFTNRLAPLHAVTAYREAMENLSKPEPKAPKPAKTPKPSKLQLAIDASKQRTADLLALADLEAKAKTNKAEARDLSARIRELREKVGEL
jgi:hypothetical protein